MGELSDELLALIRTLGPNCTEDSLDKLPLEQQRDIKDFALEVTTNWMERPVSKTEITLFLYGFLIGHNWVKDHWALW